MIEYIIVCTEYPIPFIVTLDLPKPFSKTSFSMLIPEVSQKLKSLNVSCLISLYTAKSFECPNSVTTGCSLNIVFFP